MRMLRRSISVMMAALLLAAPVLAHVTVTEAAAPIAAYNDAEQAWPAFIPYEDASGTYAYDPANEPGISPDDVDFMSGAMKGAGSSPSYYVGGNGTHLFFRMRLLGDPSDVKGGFLSSVWMVHVLQNGVHKATIGLNGKSPHEDYIYTANADGSVVHYINKTNANGNAVPGTRVTDDGSGGYYLDIQVPISRLTEIDSSLTADSVLQFRFASSKAANLSVINKDGMNAAGAYALAAPFALYKPTIAFTNLAGSYTTSPATVAGTTANAADGSAVSLSITSSATDSLIGTYPATVANHAWTATGWSALPTGSYMLKATVTNEYGSKASVSQRIDVGAAKVTITPPSNGKSEYSTFSFPTSFAGTHDRSDTGQRGVNLYVYKLTGSNPVTKTQVASKTGINVTGNNPGAWTSGTLTYTNLQTGYVYQVEAVDQLNTTVVATQRITYVANSVGITAPANGTRSTVATPTVTGTTNAGQKVELYVDNVLYGETTANGSGQWTMEIDKPLTRNADSSSFHALKALIRDESSNTREATVNYGVDAYSVSIENSSDPAAPEYTYVTTLEPVLKGRSTDSLVNVKVTDAAGQNELYSASNVTVTGGKWNVPVPANLLQNLQSYRVTVTAVHDAAQKAYAFLRTKTSTRVDIASPLEGSTVALRAPLTGTTEPNAEVLLNLNGTVLVTVTADGSGSWSHTPAADWRIGANTVTAVTSDEAGNMAEDRAAFTASLNPPPPAPTVEITEDANNDGYIAKAELTGQVDVKVTLPGGLQPGHTVTVSDGTTVTTIILDADLIAAGTLTASFPAPPDGATITVSAAVSDENTSSATATDSAVVKLGPTAPTVNGQTTGDPTPEITGTAPAGDTLTVEVGGVTYPVGISLIRSGSGWTLTVPEAHALAAGTYSVTATLTDSIGNTATDSTSNELIILPGITAGELDMTDETDTGDSQSDELTKNGHPVLVFPGQAGLIVLLEGPDGSALTEHSHYNVDSGSGSYTVTLVDAQPNAGGTEPFGTYDQGTPIGNPESTADGLYTVKVRDTWNQSKTIGTFRIDTTAPAAPTVTSQTTNNPRPVLAGTAEPGTLQVTVNGATYGTGTGLIRSGTDWTLQVTEALADGTWSVTAALTDAAGNTSVDSTTDELTIITSMTLGPLHMTPETDTGRSQEDRITKHGHPVLTLTAQPNLILTLTGPGGGTLVPSVHYSVYGADTGEYVIRLLDAVPNADGAQSFGTYVNGSPTYNAPDQADGVYTLAVSDGVGNNATAGTFVIDTTAPAVPTVERQSTNDTTPVIRGTAEGDKLTVEVGGTVYGAEPELLRSQASWTLTLPNELAPGTYPVTALAEDAAGNRSADLTSDELTIRSVDQDLLEALKLVQVRYSVTDTVRDIWESVTLPVFLVKDGAKETVVGWRSSNPDVISILPDPEPEYPDEYKAVVTRGDKDVSVILTATVSKNGRHMDRTFLLIVKSRIVLEAKATTGRSDGTIDMGGSTVPATITRTTLSNGNLIDKLIVSTTAMDTLITGVSNNQMSFTFTDQPQNANRADELAVEIPIGSLSKVSPSTGVEIKTPLARINLPAASVAGMQDSGSDLFFRVVPIRDTGATDGIFQETKANSGVQASAAGKQVLPLGEPKMIETNYTGYSTELTLPFTNMTLPSDPVQQLAYVNSLRVFIQHSDGTTRVAGGSHPGDLPGTIVYENGQPVGIKFAVTHFSTFTLFRVVDPVAAAPAPAPELPKITVVSAKILEPRNQLEVVLSGAIGSVYAKDFTVTVGGRPAEVVKAELNGAGNTIRLQLASLIPAGRRVVIQHAGYPVFTVEIQNESIHKKYINGYPDGLFKPEQSISRAEIATMLARLTIEGGQTKPAKMAYKDLPLTHWAAGYVETARLYSIMQGYEDGTFMPDKPISRAEMAAVMIRFLGRNEAKAQAAAPFRDVSGHWAEPKIALLTEMGMVTGENGLFHPDRELTRAEAVTMINRAVNRGILTGGFAPSWPDAPKSHWAFGHIEEASRNHESTRINDLEEWWFSHLD
ncbi:Ig-like domain-containing protein [Gorillibacterium sp. sgz5001074]|uniref:Ig-like domain-containing protein n=1 Tax=Gorillibacterium sp. sgz5001074 TaxID=3446695 RepID=UPI003F6687C3